MKKSRMNFSVRLLCAMAIGASMMACSKVPAGNVGVKVYLLGTSKGVDHEVLGPGRYWIGVNEDLYLFPTFQQNHTWKGENAFTFQTREGMSITTDLGISYHLEPSKVSSIFQKYRRGVDEITDTYLHNMVRDAMNSLASRDSISAMIGDGKQKMISEAEAQVRAEIKDIGIIVDKLYLIGQFNLPPQVNAAINAKIEATQRAQQSENELARAKAEAAKVIATAEGEAKSQLAIARAEAEANAMKQKTLTPELIRYEAIQKWDGKLPQVSGGNVPFVNLEMTK